MLRKIFKTGHSPAITVPKKLLDELGLKLGESVKLELGKDKKFLVITPAHRENQLALNIHPVKGARPRLWSK